MAHQSHHPMLNTAVMAARAAGSWINRTTRHLEGGDVFSRRFYGDLLTQLIEEVHDTVIQVIHKAYPQHVIYSASNQQKTSLTSPFVWFVDALDGAVNVARGFPVHAVSIALGVEDRIEQAVVFDPVRNQLFTASRGGGAYLDGRRLRLSESVPAIKQCVWSVALPAEVQSSEPVFSRLLSATNGQGLRCQGCPSLDLAYVAAGYVDAFIGDGLKAPTVAAGTLLVTEAGGSVSNWSGHILNLTEEVNCLAAPSRVQTQLISVLSPKG
jgi:myo-inositol-1(or 4)-monophosphatase